MPNENMIRVFKLDDGNDVVPYHIRDSHINIAYGECTTTAETIAKEVVLVDDPGWQLKAGSIAIVRFVNAVPANATLNIAETGAKNIYIENQAVSAIIRSGDVVTFIYDGTKYLITAIDRAASDIDNKIDLSQKGAVNGVAELDVNGKVPSSQLPSYVDDVLEYSTLSSFPATGETGKIYIALDTNLSYRWSGSTYVTIASDLALGETSSTAYRGDRGKVAYDHSADPNRITTQTAEGLYKIAVTSEGHVKSVAAVVKTDITSLGIPGQDTTYSDMTGAGASFSGVHGLVPAPAAGDQTKFLRGDGTWGVIDVTDCITSSDVATTNETQAIIEEYGVSV